MKMSVAAIVIDDNRFLAIKRRDVPIWVLPGGGVDPGEMPETAIVREVMEETGLEVAIIRKIAEYSPINKLATLTHLYECSIINGKPSIGAETRAIGFLTTISLLLRSFLSMQICFRMRFAASLRR